MFNQTKVNLAYYAAACFGVPGAWIVVDTLGLPGVASLAWRWYGFFCVGVAALCLGWVFFGWLWSLGQSLWAYEQWEPTGDLFPVPAGAPLSAFALVLLLTLHLVLGCVVNALLMGVPL